ncbi:MAG TPA: hypothetical protein VJ729_08055 [Nitrososphaeraceae archaeon]|nr:hypothetical protein [Nitrososphaeraceae archaeon]
MTSSIGWLLDVSIDNDHATLWIKTEEGELLKIRDTYHPESYILPRNEADGTHLFQVLSIEEEISMRWEDKHTNLFDSKKTRKLIHVQLRSLRYYQPLLKETGRRLSSKTAIQYRSFTCPAISLY